GLGFEPLEPGVNAPVGCPSTLTRAVPDRLPLGRIQFLPRDISRNVLGLAILEKLTSLPFGARPSPRPNGSILERKRLVGDDLVGIDPKHTTEPPAVIAGAKRGLIGEVARSG